MKCSPTEAILWGCFAVKPHIGTQDPVRNHRVLFFVLIAPDRQVRWALFLLFAAQKKIFLKKGGKIGKKFGKGKVRRR